MKRVLRKNKKVLAIFLALAMVASIIPISANALAKNNGENYAREIAKDSASGGSNTDDFAYISKLEIMNDHGNVWGKGIVTGTGDFDDDDEIGNDSSENNNRVRSYDNITYYISAAIQSQNVNDTYANGRVGYEVILPDDDDIRLVESSMSWAQDLTVKAENGEKKYTFYRNLPSTNGVAIPGGCDVPIVIEVGGKGEGDIVQPKINAWVEKCEEKVGIIPDEVYVTAAPKYNIQLVKEGISQEGIYDFSKEKFNSELGKVQGYKASYGIVLQLRNDNYNKGIKGIELPKGDITFDIDFTTSLTPTGGQKQEITNDFTPLLYTLNENKFDVYRVSGIPGSNGGGDNACYDSGKWSAVQNGNKISITVKEYKVDMTKFPKQSMGENVKYNLDDGKIGVGCFVAWKLDIIQPTKSIDTNKSIQDTYNCTSGTIQIDANESNMKATSVSGVECTKQTVETDDAQSFVQGLVAPGKYSQIIFYSPRNLIHMGTDKERAGNIQDGSDSAIIGQELAYTVSYQESSVSQLNIDSHTVAVNQLVKFDDRAIEIDPTQVTKGKSGDFNYNIVFAAKKDKSGWNHNGLKPEEDGYDSEMLNAKEEDLIYFNSLAELEEAGYVCVGALYEWRGCKTGTGDVTMETQTFIKIKSDYDIAKGVYVVTASTSAWLAKDVIDEAAAYLNKDKSDITLADMKEYAVKAMPSYSNENNFGKPSQENSININKDNPYKKATYGESGYTGGETAGWNIGDSIYIVPYVSKISKQVEQKNGTERKQKYELDNGERYVDYILATGMEFTQDVDTELSDWNTTVYITDTLPKGLTYLENSSSWGGEYTENTPQAGTVTGGLKVEPTVQKREDGTTLLTWKIENVKVQNGDMPSLHYSCEIGDQLNPSNDVKNEDILNNVAKIGTTEDKRIKKAVFGNQSTAAISLIKLASYNITKTGTKYLEQFGTANYKMVINNSGNNNKEDVYAVDTMPFDGINNTVMKGNYSILSMKLNVKAAKEIDDVNIYYTNDVQYAGKLASQVDAETIKNDWIKATIDRETGEITGEGLINGWPVAWAYVDDTMPSMSTAAIDMTYSLENAAKGDVLHNSYSQPTLVKQVKSVVYSRRLEGRVFEDVDKDGLYNNDDKTFSNVKVILYKKDGTKVAETITDENGKYSFEKLEAGDYYVEFEQGENNDFSDYKVTKKDEPASDENSKATEIDNEETSKMVKGTIVDITMPTIAQMVENDITNYEKKYQNMGLISTKEPETTTQEITTIPETTTEKVTEETTTIPETTTEKVTQETTTVPETTKEQTTVPTTKETKPETTTDKIVTIPDTTKQQVTLGGTTNNESLANITTKQNETSTSSDSKKAKVKKNVKKNGGVKGAYDKKNGKTRYAKVSGTYNLSKNSKDNADSTNSEYRQNNGNTPKTGESMTIILYLGLFLASGVLLVLFDKKFRKQNKR
ncbi:SdrD B-like domain-containing protein [Eubacterium sp.]